MLEAQSSSLPIARITIWWISVSSSRQPSASACTPVMSSSWLSLKSVVMCGWVSAAPKRSGCGVSASAPSGRTRRLSFSMPRLSPARAPAGRARRRSWSLTRKMLLLFLLGRVRRTEGARVALRAAHALDARVDGGGEPLRDPAPVPGVEHRADDHHDDDESAHASMIRWLTWKRRNHGYAK